MTSRKLLAITGTTRGLKSWLPKLKSGKEKQTKMESDETEMKDSAATTG